MHLHLTHTSTWHTAPVRWRLMAAPLVALIVVIGVLLLWPTSDATRFERAFGSPPPHGHIARNAFQPTVDRTIADCFVEMDRSPLGPTQAALANRCVGYIRLAHAFSMKDRWLELVPVRDPGPGDPDHIVVRDLPPR